jgi:hypothetical protein
MRIGNTAGCEIRASPVGKAHALGRKWWPGKRCTLHTHRAGTLKYIKGIMSKWNCWLFQIAHTAIKKRCEPGVSPSVDRGAASGFTWRGWMTTGTANKLADERADSAVVAVLTPLPGGISLSKHKSRRLVLPGSTASSSRARGLSVGSRLSVTTFARRSKRGSIILLLKG